MAGYEELRVLISGGDRAYARFWMPARPRGSVVYFPGIQSHCGWFERSAAILAEHGYALLQVDRRGCGRSDGPRGHADSVDQLLEDARAVRHELKRRSGFLNQHLLGVSWGGKLAVATYVSDPLGVAGLTLVTPGLFPRVGATQDRMAEIGFAMLYEPGKAFDIPLNDPERLASDPRWQEFIRCDSPALRQCTAGFYLASRRMDRIAGRLSTARPVPVHLMLAGDERIIDNDRTEEFFKNLGWRDVQISYFEKSRHTLEFEPDAEAYLSSLVRFLDQSWSDGAQPSGG